MNAQDIGSSSFLDLLFEHRNKAYGSYVLRTTYARRMRLAGLSLLLICLLSAAYTVMAGRNKQAAAPALPEIPTSFTEVELPLPQPQPKLPAPPASNTVSVKTEHFALPDIRLDEEVRDDERPASQEDLKEAVAGTLRLDGDSSGNSSPDIIPSNGDAAGNGYYNKDRYRDKKPDLVPVFVEQMPEFPGGEAALNRYLSDQLVYPQAASNAGQQGNVRIKFVVNEDGHISDITVLRGFGYGSEEEARRVIAAMPRWLPGRNNGIAVKVWFQLPIRFQLND